MQTQLASMHRALSHDGAAAQPMSAARARSALASVTTVALLAGCGAGLSAPHARRRVIPPALRQLDVIAASMQRAAAAVVGVASVRVVRATPGTMLWRYLRQHSSLPLAERGAIVRRHHVRGSGLLLALPQARGGRAPRVLTTFRLVRLADKITVKLADGRQLPATLVGADARSDLALLQLREGVGDLAVARVGQSRRLRFGQLIFAIGMSRHDGPYVSMGLVTSRAAFSSDASQYDDLIRSDFALRRGGAGGALLDITGEVVGINTALVRLGGGTRVSLSQPVGVFAPIAQQLALRGAVRPAWLGLTLRAPDPAVRPALGGWPSSGAQVATVAARSPAAHAGLRVGDVLLAIDGDPAAGNSWLRARLLARGPGAAVALTFARRQCDIALPAGRAQLASVVPRGPLPGERSGDAAANSVCVLQPHRAVVRLASPPALPTRTLRLEPSEGPLGGVTLTQMPARSRRADSATVDGAVELRVAEVVALSPASRLGLAVGDRLVAREGSPIRSVRRFVARYRREAGPLVLTVARGERTRLIVTAQ